MTLTKMLYVLTWLEANRGSDGWTVVDPTSAAFEQINYIMPSLLACNWVRMLRVPGDESKVKFFARVQ